MSERRRNYAHNIPAARTLRRPQTPSEAALWECLRDRRLDGLKFRRQHAVGRFVLDFYCHELHLCVEVDGPIHDSPDQLAADQVRQAELEESGISFFRLRSELIERDLAMALSELRAHISALTADPSPDSFVTGEGN